MNYGRRSVEEIRALYKKLMNESEVARVLGVSRQSMYDYRIRHGIEYNLQTARKKKTDELYGKRNKDIIDYYIGGKDIEWLCKKFGMNPPAVNYILSKYKVKRPCVDKYTDRNKEILQLRKSGVTIGEIAEKYDLKKQYISTLLCSLKKQEKAK